MVSLHVCLHTRFCVLMESSGWMINLGKKIKGENTEPSCVEYCVQLLQVLIAPIQLILWLFYINCIAYDKYIKMKNRNLNILFFLCKGKLTSNPRRLLFTSPTDRHKLSTSASPVNLKPTFSPGTLCIYLHSHI